MSGGRMLSKLLLFLASLLMVFLYVFFYFFPTVKNINQLKRSDHDMRLQKTDLSRRLGLFSPLNAREKVGFRFLDQEWQQVGPLAAEAFYQQAQRLARLVGVQDLQFFPRQAPVLSLVFSARLPVALDLISKLSRMIGVLQFSACLMEAVPAGVVARLELNRSSVHSLPVDFDSELLLQPIDRLLVPFIPPALASDFGPAFCPPRR